MKRVLLVDYMGSLYTLFHAKVVNIEQRFISDLREIIRAYNVEKTVILMEGGSEYRKGLLPTYKRARQERREQQTDAEKAAYKSFVERSDLLSETLKTLGCLTLKVYGAEADDLAGYLCVVLPEEEFQIMLMSEDSDWGQLLCRRNTVQGSYRSMTKTMPELPKAHWFNYGRFTKEKGLTPEQAFEKKMLTGDTSDSIPGIYKLGDTTATRLLETYGSLANIMASKESVDVPRMSQEAKKGLLVAQPLLELNYKLMNLRWTAEQWGGIIGIDSRKQKLLHECQVFLSSQENPVSQKDFNEVCYENGWIDFVGEQWIFPFVSK